jgi:hypothetical protein
MKTARTALGAAVLAALVFTTAAFARDETLKMTLSRDFGYGGFNNDIQGTFSFHVSGPADLERVEFYIDQEKIGEDTAAPFSLQFVTDNYPLGAHDLYAVGFTTGGLTLRSNTAQRIFVTAAEGGQAGLRFVLPLLVVVFGAMALAAVGPLLLGRKKASPAPGTPRSYTFGGGICPRCHRPFPFALFSMNLVASKFTRCPYCGRWGVVGFASPAQLHAAEQAELQSTGETVPEESAEEKLQRDLENSKFQDN